MLEQAEEFHLDPASEIELEAIKKRAIRGVAILTGRTFLLNILSLVATGFLTVFLGPNEFGVFWTVSAIVNFFTYFSDIGLAAALIQKKERVTDEELKTTFTIQQILVLMLLFLLFSLTPFLQSYYALSQDGKILLFALGLSLLLSSFKTIPSVLLERELDFSRLVIPQVLENLVYNFLVVVLAWRGFGLASFTYAILVRSFIGLFAIYLLKPWVPGIAFNRKALKGLLTFGVPYQANTLLATIKDDGMTAFLGGVLGTEGIGILGWAQKWAYMPLRLFMDHVLKVTFPAFSRMQENKKSLSKAVTRSIFFVSFFVFPACAGLLILAPLLIDIIPRYKKWEPALLPLFFISINTFLAASTTQLTNLLNAIGKIKITFKLMLMWTILTWVLVPILGVYFGVNGAALGYLLVGLSSIVAIFVAYKIVPFSLLEAVVKPLIGTAIMSAIVVFVRTFLPTTLTTVLILIGLALVFYIAIMYLIVGGRIIEDATKGIKEAFSKN